MVKPPGRSEGLTFGLGLPQIGAFSAVFLAFPDEKGREPTDTHSKNYKPFGGL